MDNIIYIVCECGQENGGVYMYTRIKDARDILQTMDTSTGLNGNND